MSSTIGFNSSSKIYLHAISDRPLDTELQASVIEEAVGRSFLRDDTGAVLIHRLRYPAGLESRTNTYYVWITALGFIADLR
jgi:hypothetical protein